MSKILRVTTTHHVLDVEIPEGWERVHGGFCRAGDRFFNMVTEKWTDVERWYDCGKSASDFEVLIRREPIEVNFSGSLPVLKLSEKGMQELRNYGNIMRELFAGN